MGSHRGSTVSPGVNAATGIFTSPMRVPSAKCFLLRSGPNPRAQRLTPRVVLALDCEYRDDFFLPFFLSPSAPRSTSPIVTSRAMSVITVGSQSLVRLP